MWGSHSLYTWRVLKEKQSELSEELAALDEKRAALSREIRLLKTDPAYVEKVIEPIQNGEADVVIGSRFIDNQGFQSSASRRAGIHLLSGLIKLCTWKKIKDVTSGFRAVNEKFINIYADDYPSDYPEPEAIVSAVMNRGIVKEVPVVMRERESGKSSINFTRSLYYMIKVSLAIIICRISYGIRR